MNKQEAPAKGAFTPEQGLKARALLTHLYLEQLGIPHSEVTAWRKDKPEDRRTYRF